MQPTPEFDSANYESDKMAKPEEAAKWRQWGPYVSARAWGTVREDYSPDGNAWNYFSHDMARSRAYRWSEDGIAGICDDQQTLCFAPTFWNGRDPILKERFFGLTNQEGNHGEDVKEYWFATDNVPSHSYMKMIYRYPHAEFPYRSLVEINRHRGPNQPEYELVDTGVFADDAFFDITIEYCKLDPCKIYARITVKNCGKVAAPFHLLPTIWYRNTWAWNKGGPPEPVITLVGGKDNGDVVLKAAHQQLGAYYLHATGVHETLFTFNETNRQKLYNVPNNYPAVKDALHDYIINGKHNAVHQKATGTKAAVYFTWLLAPQSTKVVELLLADAQVADPFKQCAATFEARQKEADHFYNRMLPGNIDPQWRQVSRQALSGILWNKQFYNYPVAQWLRGDDDAPAPPQRLKGRNHEWNRLNARDIIVMPDSWEYPWFAAWDWAFHLLTLCYVDLDLAKSHLELIVSERYQNLSGQLPAYEWAFGDVNPPVHALATWRIYNNEKRRKKKGDHEFLERMFHKLLINFVWWVNRKDSVGKNIFQGGFLGLDNISIFNRSQPLPAGLSLEQADGTGWMGLFCLNMMTISIELSQVDPSYSHMALKFFDHFLAISEAINSPVEGGSGLWDSQDGFYYDKITNDEGRTVIPLRLRSNVGIIPLYAVQILEKNWFVNLPAFKDRWQSSDMRDRIDCGHVGVSTSADGERLLLSIANQHRLERVLARVVDENEFLSPHGIRSLSRHYLDNPYRLRLDGHELTVHYEPAESTSGLFGGNSNWRGPVWFPTNYLLITALRTYNRFYGDSVKVNNPCKPGEQINLLQLSEELCRRLITIFTRQAGGKRPAFGGQAMFQDNPLWKDLMQFNEYFHGDNGAGIGASHQTGWTALVVQMIDYATRNYQSSGA
jgi:hypothetical protein